MERWWIHGKVNNELIERIILNVKNGGKQASSYTVNLCRKEITLAQHAKVVHDAYSCSGNFGSFFTITVSNHHR